ncbi:coiled-coil domain-containing protein 57-like [Boleophthalmus pectinirostris]|uniref:coiled-coil domain-containing protein 57-like n=1 Tax=Boleophthalmus pectinirostris TaxID=150288 RepID=UPI00242A57B5|nr:coiled-coil domain-containing protein 57-like [Boleophthalmus pectinirostris]
MEQQVQLRTMHRETSEDIHQKTKALLGIQKNSTYVDIQRAQRSPDKNHKDQLKEVHKPISKLQRDLATQSTQALSMKTQHQEQLQEREDIIDRYKKELRASLEREKHLEQRMVQMELEWQKKCEEIQSKHYLDHERLIQELTAAREKVNAELVETKLQLEELTVLLQCVTKERDLALQGCVPDTGLLASHEIIPLKQQNYRLQVVVSEMRKQMEELISTTSPPQQPHTEFENSVNKKYNTSEKEDVQDLEPNVTTVEETSQKSSCVCCCGRVSRENTALVQLRSRLKQAALRIARLNRDRQQLTELCNRLRSQVCTELISQSNSIKGNHRLHESTNNLKTVNSEKESQVLVDSELLTTQSAPPYSSQLFQLNRQSEESLPSLSALWALLDQRPSQDLSEDNEDNQHPAEVNPEVLSLGLVTGGAQMEVCGVSAPIHNQPTAKPPQKRETMKHTAKSARIRNYNIKD